MYLQPADVYEVVLLGLLWLGVMLHGKPVAPDLLVGYKWLAGLLTANL